LGARNFYCRALRGTKKYSTKGALNQQSDFGKNRNFAQKKDIFRLRKRAMYAEKTVLMPFYDI
jgi:hypothetical protein